MAGNSNSGDRPHDSKDYAALAELDQQRARHEKIKADQRELKLRIEAGEYLPREAQRAAASTIIALFSQAMRSVPDNLERACSLTPAQAEEAARLIDAALTDLANGLRQMVRDEPAP